MNGERRYFLDTNALVAFGNGEKSLGKFEDQVAGCDCDGVCCRNRERIVDARSSIAEHRVLRDVGVLKQGLRRKSRPLLLLGGVCYNLHCFWKIAQSGGEVYKIAPLTK